MIEVLWEKAELGWEMVGILSGRFEEVDEEVRTLPEGIVEVSSLNVIGVDSVQAEEEQHEVYTVDSHIEIDCGSEPVDIGAFEGQFDIPYSSTLIHLPQNISFDDHSLLKRQQEGYICRQDLVAMMVMRCTLVADRDKREYDSYLHLIQVSSHQPMMAVAVILKLVVDEAMWQWKAGKPPIAV
jgi:hypothetical protein